jgi:hypothetical protein
VSARCTLIHKSGSVDDLTGAFEIAECRPASGIEQCLEGGVRMLRRVVDLETSCTVVTPSP